MMSEYTEQDLYSLEYIEKTGGAKVPPVFLRQKMRLFQHHAFERQLPDLPRVTIHGKFIGEEK